MPVLTASGLLQEPHFQKFCWAPQLTLTWYSVTGSRSRRTTALSPAPEKVR